MSPIGAQLACDWCFGKKKKNISSLLFEWKWKLHLLISFWWPVGINLLGADWPTAVTSSPCHNSSFVPFTKGCHVSMAIGSTWLQIHVHRFSPGLFDCYALYLYMELLPQHSLPTWGSTTVRNRPDGNTGLSSYLDFTWLVTVIF